MPKLNATYVTQVKTNYGNGLLKGVDGAMWLYRKVPMVPVMDAAGASEINQAAEPIIEALASISALSTVGFVPRRALSKGSYRSVHFLWIDVPVQYAPARSKTELGAWQRTNFRHKWVPRRELFLGVRLIPSIRRKERNLIDQVSEAYKSFVDSIVIRDVPMEDWRDDIDRVSNALARGGLIVPSNDDMRFAGSWWNHGRVADNPYLVHSDHLHVFGNVGDAKTAARLDETSKDNPDSCQSWNLPTGFALTWANVVDLDLPFLDSSSPLAQWAIDLQQIGAHCISVRGIVEPARVTRAEIERSGSQHSEDIEHRSEKYGQRAKSEQVEQVGKAHDLTDLYGTNQGYPTLVNTTITVGLDGVRGDLETPLMDSAVTLASNPYQLGSFIGSMLCASSMDANPYRQDLPSTAIACSGLPSLSTGGDPAGALLGFGESDGLAYYLSGDSSSKGDQLPVTTVFGDTGSGKTQLILHLAHQWARERIPDGSLRPVTILDYKEESDFSEFVTAAGGRVSSLDQLSMSDGIFDPIRILPTETGLTTATDMLVSINPWGDKSQADKYSIPIMTALRHGVLTRKATCIGQALEYAKNDMPDLDPFMFNRIEELRKFPLFSGIMGYDPQGESLKAAGGLSLIKLGSQAIPLPNPDAPESSHVYQRVGAWLLRMGTYGSIASMRGRYGNLIVDEAWKLFLDTDSGKQVEMAGRLARSWKVQMILATQKVEDFVNANLSEYINRTLALSLSEKQAPLLTELVSWPKDANPEFITSRLNARETKKDGLTPNPMSLKALFNHDPATGDRTGLARGSVALAWDHTKRMLPVVIDIPPQMLAMTQTSAKND